MENAARGLLRGIGKLSQALFRIGDFGLSRSHMGVLDAMEDRPRRVTELATYTGVTQPRVTVVLQDLEDRGLVERRRSAKDRRAVEASLTPAGADLLRQGRQRMSAALLDALRADVEDPEHTVAVARDAVSTLLHAFEPEIS
ncbi:transcriptional regulator [Streptomyces tsukubensis]|uniref:Transcriptional regulator n=1 Tax=Streptomyces tsukubensis TaxID=83656 RepID=A0A1V4AGX8_9ACTN|nr:transcriptional regulator [Streptomyces tsukubensis]